MFRVLVYLSSACTSVCVVDCVYVFVCTTFVSYVCVQLDRVYVCVCVCVFVCV